MSTFRFIITIHSHWLAVSARHTVVHSHNPFKTRQLAIWTLVCLHYQLRWRSHQESGCHTALEDAQPLTSIPSDVAWVVDAMAIIQSTKATTNMAYSQSWPPYSVQRHHQKVPPTDSRIDWVLDTWPEVSLKNTSMIKARLLRGALQPKQFRGAEGQEIA